MSRFARDSIYGYGFCINEDEILAKNPSLFNVEVEEWVKENEEGDPSDAYADAKDEADYENRSITAADLIGYPDDLQEIVDSYLIKNFPAVMSFCKILDDNNEENHWFFLVGKSLVFLEHSKISDAKKPTTKAKEQLKAFRKLLGATLTNPSWDNVSYIDYP